jgi:hypothetical protein
VVRWARRGRTGGGPWGRGALPWPLRTPTAELDILHGARPPTWCRSTSSSLGRGLVPLQAQLPPTPPRRTRQFLVLGPGSGGRRWGGRRVQFEFPISGLIWTLFLMCKDFLAKTICTRPSHLNLDRGSTQNFLFLFIRSLFRPIFFLGKMLLISVSL